MRSAIKRASARGGAPALTIRFMATRVPPFTYGTNTSGCGSRLSPAHRTDDADDRHPRHLRIRVAALDPASDDRLAGHVLAHERLVDNGDARFGAFVARDEWPAVNRRNRESVEIRDAHRPQRRARPRRRVGHDMVLDCEVDDRGAAAERQVVHDGRSPTAGHVGYRLEQTPLEFDPARRRPVPRLREHDLE